MYKRSMIFVIVVFLIIAVVLVCVIPRFTRVNITLNATKINAQGEALGTYEIFLHGNRLDYISGNSALDVSISEFDDMIQFIPFGRDNTGTKITTEPGSDIPCARYSAWDSKSDTVVDFDIGFSPDMDRWIFINTDDKVYYVSSVSGTYTSTELMEYFSNLIPNNITAS